MKINVIGLDLRIPAKARWARDKFSLPRLQQ